METLEERLLTCEQVAERYSVKLKTVWTWIRTKKLSASKVGGRVYRIRRVDLEEFEKQYKTTKEGSHHDTRQTRTLDPRG